MFRDQFELFVLNNSVKIVIISFRINLFSQLRNEHWPSFGNSMQAGNLRDAKMHPESEYLNNEFLYDMSYTARVRIN